MSQRPWLELARDWRRPSAEGSYSLFWDRDKAYGQLLPRPEVEAIPSFYEMEDYYTHGPAGRGAAGRADFIDRLLGKVAYLADRRNVDPDSWWRKVLGEAPLRILDIGAGSGGKIKRFRALGHECVGVEPDRAALRAAHDAGYPVYEGTAEQLPSELDGETFDAIVFAHVLEHCLDPELALRNALAMLKPGGLLMVDVPNNECLGVWYFGPSWHYLDVPRHLNFFGTKSLRDIVLQAGAIPESVEYRGYLRQFSTSWIETQRQISRALGNQRALSRWQYLPYLLLTFAAPARRKYDSVRVLARKSAGGAEVGAGS